MKVPKFVSLNGTALRLIEKSYYRDAGDWSIRYKVIGGVLLSWAWGMNMPWLHKKPLIKITEAKWRKGNEGYIPKEML